MEFDIYQKIGRENAKRFYDRIDKTFYPYVFVLSIAIPVLYVISWIYQTNLRMEDVDPEAPDSKRCFTILIMMPLSWYFIAYFIDLFVVPLSGIFASSIIYVGWALITYVSLQYVYDFCVSFAKLTFTNELGWYLLLYPAYVALIFIGFFKVFWVVYLYLLPCFAITMMQYYLLDRADRVHRNMNASTFNYKVKNM